MWAPTAKPGEAARGRSRPRHTSGRDRESDAVDVVDEEEEGHGTTTPSARDVSRKQALEAISHRAPTKRTVGCGKQTSGNLVDVDGVDVVDSEDERHRTTPPEKKALDATEVRGDRGYR